MKLLVTHRFRLYPNKRQERQMEDTLETCRRLYNSLLADRNEKGTGFYEQEKSLVTLKSEEKFLRAANAQVLQDVVLRLDKAFQAFLRRPFQASKGSSAREGTTLSHTHSWEGSRLLAAG
jgi:putative transposase